MATKKTGKAEGKKASKAEGKKARKAEAEGKKVSKAEAGGKKAPEVGKDEAKTEGKKASKKARKAGKASKKAPKVGKDEAKRRKKAAKKGARALKPVEPTAEGAKDWQGNPRELLRVGEGFQLSSVDPGATPGWEGDQKEAERRMLALGEELSELQERLFAEGRAGGRRAILLVLQGLDTAGKGGIVRHVIGMVDPQGVALRSFGVPTPEEREHDFLWRIDRSLPPGGKIGVFDRSQYEDVLVARVDDLAPLAEIDGRYGRINDFERALVDRETFVVKVALVVSPDEQYRRLRERLERPDKHWKWSNSDLQVRSKRPAYDEAYQLVFDRTSTDYAPWYAVPADHKWYARLAVTELLTQALRDLDLTWPKADFDVAEAIAKLDASQE